MADPHVLEVAAHVFTAGLCVWLGLVVTTRARGDASSVLGVLALTLAVGSTVIVIERLTLSGAAMSIGRRLG